MLQLIIKGGALACLTLGVFGAAIVLSYRPPEPVESPPMGYGFGAIFITYTVYGLTVLLWPLAVWAAVRIAAIRGMIRGILLLWLAWLVVGFFLAAYSVDREGRLLIALVVTSCLCYVALWCVVTAAAGHRHRNRI